MGNYPLNIIDLRPKPNPKHTRRSLFHHKKWLFWIIPLTVLLMVLISFCFLEIRHIEKQYSNTINLLPEIGNDLNAFNWDEALSKINSLDMPLPIVKSFNQGLEKILEHMPFFGQREEIRLYYNLKYLAKTLDELTKSNVFKTDNQNNSSWGDLYPKLIQEVDNVILVSKSLKQNSLLEQWQNLAIKLKQINKLFGNPQPINYLFILNDINQARPLGGEIAGVVAATVSNWEIDYWQAYNASSVDNQISSKIIPPKELQLISTNWTFRQSNWFGDLNLFAQSLTTLWKQSGAGSLFEPDALVLFNIQDIEPLDGYLGNISLGSQTITSLKDYLEANLKSYRLSSGPLAEDYLSFVNDSFPQNLKNLKGKEWLSILQSYAFNTNSSGLNNFYFLPWKQANLAKEFNVSEKVPTFFFTHSDLNLPVSNISSRNLKTSAKVTIKKGTDGYNMEWTISLTNQNPNSFTDFIRFYLPENTSISSLSGLDKYLIPDDPINYTVKKFLTDPLIENWEKQKNCLGQNNYCLLEEGNKTILAGWLKIKSGQTKTIKVQLLLPLATNEFRITPQMGNSLTLLLGGDALLSSKEILPYLEKSTPLNKDLLIQFNHD
ncbi:MAG: hypothetical protein NTX26_02525 [Candidatus Parcubacteria bacterium]|nr:hypothetical protein [Candidatus Parcubacteria bacterium]